MDDPARPAAKEAFRSGVAAGVAASLGLLHACFSIVITPTLRATLAEFQAELPAITRLAVNSVWSIAAPLAILSSLVAAGKVFSENESRRFAAFVALAAIAAGLFALTYWASYLPFSQLAGNNQAD